MLGPRRLPQLRPPSINISSQLSAPEHAPLTLHAKLAKLSSDCSIVGALEQAVVAGGAGGVDGVVGAHKP